VTRRLHWLVACAAFGLLIGVATGPRAQEDKTDSCRQACFDTEESCYESCEASNDAASCEEACQQSLDACLEACK
jgi:hypothetical protein